MSDFDSAIMETPNPKDSIHIIIKPYSEDFENELKLKYGYEIVNIFIKQIMDNYF